MYSYKTLQNFYFYFYLKKKRYLNALFDCKSVGVSGVSPISIQACVCVSVSVASFLCLLASGSGAVAAPKGLGGCLLVTSVSVVAPKACSAKFICAHTSFLGNSFFPFPTYKGVDDS